MEKRFVFFLPSLDSEKGPPPKKAFGKKEEGMASQLL